MKIALNRKYTVFSAIYLSHTEKESICKVLCSLAPLALPRSLRSLVPLPICRSGAGPVPAPLRIARVGPRPPHPRPWFCGPSFNRRSPTLTLSFFVTGAPAPLLAMRVHVLLSRYRSQHDRPLHPALVVYSRVRLLSTYQPTACYFLRISPQPATIVIAFTEVGNNPHVCYIRGINPHVCSVCRYQPARTLRPLCVRLRDSDFNCALPSGPRSAFSSALRTDVTTCLFSICGSITLAPLAPCR